MTPLDLRAPRLRLALFAFGDFGFNLYWQSAMLFLLFYYTDSLGIPVAIAGTIYLAASVWDGIASFAAGVAADRYGSERGYARALGWGALPLGLAFMAAYAAPAGGGTLTVAAAAAGHFLFRTAYAAVNVPYSAMAARISPDARDRSFVAGTRMLSGTAAAVTVALGSVPLGAWLAGSSGARAYFAAAIMFAGIATAVLLWVARSYREVAPVKPPARVPLPQALLGVVRNRAFITLSAAMMAMIVATTFLNKAVLYYFKYLLGDEAGGRLALAAMLASSAAAVPCWMLVARRSGLRAVWLLAVAACVGGLALFAASDVTRSAAMQVFLAGMQMAIVGLHFAFWALLPEVIDRGERTTGIRVEGVVVGLAALLQRVAIGVATGLLGWSFADAGFTANVAQSAGTQAGMRAAIALVPLLFFALSGAVMLASGLGRSHPRSSPD